VSETARADARWRWAGPALAVVVFAAALVALERELRAFRYRDVSRALHAIPPTQVAAALALTALSYAILVGYDALALRYVRHRLAAWRVAFGSFVSYAVSHTLGFPVLTGGAVRLRFWSAWGLSTGEIAQAVSFAGATFTLGMVLMAGLVLTFAPGAELAALGPPVPVRPLGMAALVVVATYLAWSVARGRRAAHRARVERRRASDRGVPEPAAPALVASPTAGAGLTPELSVATAAPDLADLADPMDGMDAATSTPLLGMPTVTEPMFGTPIVNRAVPAPRRGEIRVGGWAFPVPSPSLAVAQILLAAADWAVAGSVLYALLPRPAGTTGVSFLPFLGAFLLAQFAGVISHVPGGLGVFEFLVVRLLRPYVPDAAAVLGALVAYRAVYYLLPFVTALVALAVHETRHVQARVAGGVVQGARVVGRVAPRIVPLGLSFATFAAGAVLLFSGATPSVHSRVAVLDAALPLGVIELSHFAASVAGAALVVLAWALARRLDAAWGLAVLALVVGIVGSLLKGLDWEEASVLAAVLGLLVPARPAFYRKAALTHEPFTPGWTLAVLLVLAGTVWLGLFSFHHVEYSHDLWWRFTVRGDAPRFLRASVGVLSALLVFALLRLLRHAPAEPEPPGEADLARARDVVASASATEANLALLGDKSLLFSDSGRTFLMYGVSGRSWVALGDPVGPQEEHAEIAWRFKEAADAHGGWTVFYQASVDHLPLYIDLGLTLLKLGEEARVPLDRFSLDGGARKGMRRIVNAVEKQGVRFEVVEAAAVPALLPELRRISDDWIARKSVREKGFSLGYFDERYLVNFPVALVLRRDDAGDVAGERPVAFANLWRGADRGELSVDLMRYASDAPESVMEYLFIQLLLWGKAQGYAEFNLGMAPLSGFESRSLAPLWSRAGALLYRHGEHFYNFQGLRRYKEKFDPVWEPKYLASPGGLVLPRVLTNVTSLISGGLRGVIAR
jgi:phosphatidylglycerol lysyltransferase